MVPRSSRPNWITRAGLLLLLCADLAAAQRSPTFPRNRPLGIPPESPAERFARLIPEFGGAYRAPDGGLMLRVTDTSLARSHGPDAVRELVLKELLAFGRDDIKTVQFEACKYSYSQLRTWLDAGIHDSAAVQGAFSWGIDQRTSRIRVGVPDTTTGRRVRAELEKIGTPADALVMEVETPDRTRPPAL